MYQMRREMETIFLNPNRISRAQNTVSAKNKQTKKDGIKIRLDTTEEMISELEDRTMKTIDI